MIDEITYDTEAEANTEIVLTNAASNFVETLAEENEARIMGTNFDMTASEGIVRIFNAEEDGTSLNDSGLTELVLDGIIIRPGVRVDPVHGTRTPCANTILMATDGNNYVSQSNGIARSAARIIHLYEKLGWPEEGLPVRVTENKLDGRRSYKKLTLM